jgi:hypothetical protein
VIGDLLVFLEMLRSEARQKDCGEEMEMREVFIWTFGVAFLAVAILILDRLWLVADALRIIAEKLS